MRFTRLAVVVTTTILTSGVWSGGATATVDQVWSGGGTASRSTPTGETVTVTVRWKNHSVGPAGGVPYTEYECDAVFSGPATSVAQKTSLVCSGGGSMVTDGVTVTSPGPVAVAGGATETTYTAPHCVQGITYYSNVTVPATLISPAWVLVPHTCFS